MDKKFIEFIDKGFKNKVRNKRVYNNDIDNNNDNNMFNQTKSQYQFEIEDQILQINNKRTQSPTYSIHVN